MTSTGVRFRPELGTSADWRPAYAPQSTLKAVEDVIEQVTLSEVMKDPVVQQEVESKESALDTAVEIARQPGTMLSRRQASAVQTANTPQTLLAEWDGYVISIEDRYFIASLEGVSGEGVEGEEEDAEIPVSDVGGSDRDLLQPGAFFRLCVFYELQENERPRRYTQVIFRRLPAYRAEELEKAAVRGAELHRGLRVE